MSNLHGEWFAMHFKYGGTMTWGEIAEQYGTTRNTVKNAALRWGAENGKLGEAPSKEEVPSTLPKEGTQLTLPVEVVDPHVLPENWLDQLWENAKEQARLRLATEKEEMVYHVRVPETKPFMLVWTADWHLLDGGTDHDLFDSWMEDWTTTDGLYFGIGGDLANWFSPAVLPRAMPANTLPSDYTEPLIKRKVVALHGKRKRVLFGVIGNHDEFPGATGWHPVNDIYRELEISNLGSGGNVYIEIGTKDEKWSDISYKVAARHSFNFNSSVNDTNSMRNLWVQAGCPKIVLTAHLHRPTMHMPTFDGVDTVWMRNGTPKRNDHHAKSKNFVHTKADAPDQPGVILFPGEDKLIPFRHYKDGLPLLKALREGATKKETT